MKITKMFHLVLAASLCTVALGQAKPAAPAPTPTIASTVDQQVSILEREFVSAAEAMPDDKYNFAPTSLNIPGSDYKGVRTFGQQVRHVATVNFMLWAP
ncbi:MAG TPA: DinB family protein, partial [Terriglobales bacterium]|nr:DinB family protein [Terriglobales bacterium]